jgi:hydroxymethylbilane synthase
LPAGLKLGAVSRRADVRDVLIYRDLDFLVGQLEHSRSVDLTRRGFRPALTIHALPYGATLATSSPRRAAQTREQRPDLKVVPIRGNVGTRLRKMIEQSELDAMILAAAGLERLNFRISPSGQLEGEGVPPGLAATPLSIAEMLPCVGQAALGIEIREDDPRLEPMCAKLDHLETRQCVTAERALLTAMGGGCNLAVAAYAEPAGEELRMRAISFLDGKPRRAEARGSVHDPAALGKTLAAQLRQP